MKTLIFFFTGLVLFLCETQAQKVTDYDGNTYDTVVIGSQVWLRPNLRVTHYNNGIPIPNVVDTVAWAGLSTGARCYYANDSSMYDSIYGPLYNWYAVRDTGGICPAGWHVSTNQEWSDAEAFLGVAVVGGAMKEAGTLHWTSPNVGATNSTGFTGLPGGMRDSQQNNFRTLTENGLWWTATTYGSNSWSVYMWNMSTYIDHNPTPRTLGLSVRCLKDVVTGLNDEKDYQGIRIYPVPSANIVTVECPGKEMRHLRMFDLAGNSVMEKIIDNGRTEIDISILPSGIYIIKIVCEKSTATGKLIRK
jgi:uncharacterized protein (TIGR02145 family)